MLGLVGPGARIAAAHGDGSYPRTYNLDWRNVINAVADSRYDVLVHSEHVLNIQLDSVRVLNPAIKRLTHDSWYIYYNAGPSGYAADWGPFDASDPSLGWDRKYWDLMQQNNWWLWAVDSSGVRYHAAMAYQQWCGNFTTACPRNAQGQRLCDVYADFLLDNLSSQRHSEGIFFDFCNDGYGWMNWYMWGNCPDGQNCSDPSLPRTPGTKFKTAFDCNADGLPDAADSVDAWWKGGMNIIMARLRARMGPNFILVGNGQHHFTMMNGAMIERFPFVLGARDPQPNPYLYQWHDNMFSTKFGYLETYEKIFSQPRHDLIDVTTAGGTSTEPDRTVDRERHKRFTLGSALLGDGYYGIRGNAATYTWWEPEWDLHLGWPMGPATNYVAFGFVNLWHRQFDRGDVWVNATGFAVAESTDHPAVPAWDAVIRENGPGTTQSAPSTGVRLEAPRPNPVADAATIEFLLPADTPGTLLLFDVHGRMVKEIWKGVGTGSLQTAVWDGTSDPGFDVPAGMYFATLFSQGHKMQRRLVRLY
jgi:hypothetical protein